MTAFCASKELSCSFIACTGLHLPRVSQIVSTLWTQNISGRISLQLLVLFSYNHNSFLGLLRNNRPSCSRLFGRLLTITHCTNKNGALFGSPEDHPFSTRRTKLHSILFLKQDNRIGHYSILT